MRLTGGEILCKALIAEGVDLIFGYPGGAILPFYDDLVRNPDLKHVLIRHEQGAAHAADGYARATGKVGVCLATSGPGAINLATGLATANMDSTPIVAITGQVARAAIGKDAFQETDITGITLPITKHNYLVMTAGEIPDVVKEAFHIARTGRPGPVLIDIPKDVFVEEAEYVSALDTNLPGYKPTVKGNNSQIKRAATLINESSKPVILAGRGVMISEAENELKELAEQAQIPVVPTLLGIGGFPGTHYLNLGLMGMHGSAYANLAVDQSDLIIGIGCRFDDRIVGRVSDFATGAQIIHIDIDPAAIGQNVPAHVPIVGDAKTILADLVPRVEGKNRSNWLQHVDNLRHDHPLLVPESEKLLPQHVIQRIFEETNGDAVVITGVGQHQMWAAQFYLIDKPMNWITSGGLGTMGYEVPAALGAAMGRPDDQVWSICGDGGFQMTLNELATIRDENIPVKFAIINNGNLGMVRQWQELFYDKRYSQIDVKGPDFIKLADAYGMHGIRVTSKDSVNDAILEANTHPGPVIVDFVVEAEENVYPMIPAGQSVKEMVEAPRPVSEAQR